MSVGPEVVRALIGSLETEKAIKGILLTTGTITKAAREEASIAARVELFDGLQLQGIVDTLGIESPKAVS
jgi:restriction endonuclease Mrr